MDNHGIWIDGEGYAVDYTKFSRSARVERKYGLTTADGTRHGEISGVYVTYTIVFSGMERDEYDRLFDALIAPIDYRTLKLPDGHSGHVTFSAMITDVADSLLADPYDGDYGRRIWDEMTVTAVSRTPRVEIDEPGGEPEGTP